MDLKGAGRRQRRRADGPHAHRGLHGPYDVLGKAINPAHQNRTYPWILSIKMRLLNELADVMRKMGRRVEVNFY